MREIVSVGKLGSKQHSGQTSDVLGWINSDCCITHVISHIALGPQVLDNEAKLDICVPYKQYDY